MYISGLELLILIVKLLVVSLLGSELVARAEANGLGWESPSHPSALGRRLSSLC